MELSDEERSGSGPSTLAASAAPLEAVVVVVGWPPGVGAPLVALPSAVLAWLAAWRAYRPTRVPMVMATGTRVLDWVPSSSAAAGAGAGAATGAALTASTLVTGAGAGALDTATGFAASASSTTAGLVGAGALNSVTGSSFSTAGGGAGLEGATAGDACNHNGFSEQQVRLHSRCPTCRNNTHWSLYSVPQGQADRH